MVTFTIMLQAIHFRMLEDGINMRAFISIRAFTYNRAFTYSRALFTMAIGDGLLCHHIIRVARAQV